MGLGESGRSLHNRRRGARTVQSIDVRTIPPHPLQYSKMTEKGSPSSSSGAATIFRYPRAPSKGIEHQGQVGPEAGVHRDVPDGGVHPVVSISPDAAMGYPDRSWITV